MGISLSKLWQGSLACCSPWGHKESDTTEQLNNWTDSHDWPRHPSLPVTHCLSSLFFSFFFLLYNIILVLPYINMHLPQVYTCSPSWTPLPSPSPYHPSGLSQCTSPKLPVSCIKPGLAIHFLYDIIHVLMPFSQIISPSLSHRVQKTVLYISVSFAVSYTVLLLPSF